MFDVFRRQLTIRSSPGIYGEDGIWVNLPYVQSTIIASVQSIDDDVLATLPEGYRTRDNFLLITDTFLKLAVPNESRADVVLIDGFWYQVVKVKTWKNTWQETKHCEAIVIKMDDDDVN